jgi:hypothetical protein
MAGFTAARSYGVGSAHVGLADAYGATGASAAGVLLGDETSFTNKPAAGSNYGRNQQAPRLVAAAGHVVGSAPRAAAQSAQSER